MVVQCGHEWSLHITEQEIGDKQAERMDSKKKMGGLLCCSERSHQNIKDARFWHSESGCEEKLLSWRIFRKVKRADAGWEWPCWQVEGCLLPIELHFDQVSNKIVDPSLNTKYYFVHFCATIKEFRTQPTENMLGKSCGALLPIWSCVLLQR